MTNNNFSKLSLFFIFLSTILNCYPARSSEPGRYPRISNSSRNATEDAITEDDLAAEQLKITNPNLFADDPEYNDFQNPNQGPVQGPIQGPVQGPGGTQRFEWLLERFVEQGAPRQATARALEFLKANTGKTFLVNGAKGKVSRKIENNKYLIVIDFTLPSNQKRLYFLNLMTSEVYPTYVAHGEGSGLTAAVRFSNIPDSKMSSLGFYLTDGTYSGSHGESIYLLGLSNSNDMARKRMIVIHRADYVSESFIKAHQRLGRSWGCPAVSNSFMPVLLKSITQGAIVYTHHY